MLGSGTAAAADQVHEPFLRHPAQGIRGLGGGLVIGTHLVGQAGVGIAAHGAVRPGGDVGDKRGEFARAERAIESEAERAGVADGTEKGFQGLPGQGAAAAVGDGHGDEQGQGGRFGEALDGPEGGFGVQGVEAGLQQQGVHAAFEQAPDLLGIGRRHLIEINGPPGRVGEVLGEGEGLAGGAE